MANEHNLIPFNMKTESERRENASKAGKKSGEARRQKRSMKDAMKLLLSLDLPECEGKENLKKLGLDDEELTIQLAMLATQVQKALAGDLDSAKFVRDTAGEKPIEIIANANLNEEAVKNIEDYINDRTK